jgi:hypothetical protein
MPGAAQKRQSDEQKDIDAVKFFRVGVLLRPEGM